jgi:hypothetical protein
MMGRLKNDQGQLFYEFRLGDAVQRIIWCGRLTLRSIYLGFEVRLRPTIRPWAARRLTRS